MVAELMNAVISTFLVVLIAIFPSSPVVFSIDPNLIVPAYSGVLVTLLLYFRDVISREPIMAIKGFKPAQLRYVTLASALTIVLGFLPRVQVERRIAVIAGIALAVLPAIAYGFKPLEGLRKTFEDEPTLVDALSVGVAQALAMLLGLPRGGTSALALEFAGYDAKRILRFSLQVAPAYLVVEIIRAGQCQLTPKWLGPLAFALSFFFAKFLLWMLFKLVERIGSRTFLALYGLVGAVLYLMGVVM